MKQLEVQIMGQSYLLGCPENGDARMLDAVNRVDIAMCKIRDAGKIKARDRIAVLAALNLAFELPDRTAEPAAVAPSPALTSTLAPTPTSPAVPSQVRTAAATHFTTADAPGATRPHEDHQLTSLLNRLDTALGVDGQLL